MKVGVIIYSNDSETVWNAFRLANLSLTMGDEVKVFLLGKGVVLESLDTDSFKVREQLQTFTANGGRILACTTCLELHQIEAPTMFIVSTLKDLYEIVKESDKIITF